jgi:hypothetical protein
MMSDLEQQHHVEQLTDRSTPSTVSLAPRPSRRALVACAAGVVMFGSRTNGAEARPGRGGGATPIGSSWVSPFAAAQPTEVGRRIRGLVVHGDRLYIGYGDYGANSGPIQLHYLDLKTGVISGSVLELPFEDNTNMKVLDGALYAANIDPRTYWEGGQPFATNRSGAWTLSGWTNACHAFDVELVPGLPGAIMASGAWLGGAGEGSYATWLSLDGGATWKTFADIVTTKNQTRVYRLARFADQLYCTTPDATWRWRGIVPATAWNAFEDGWEQVDIPGFTDARGEFAQAYNGRFYAWNYGPTMVFDGTTVRALFGDVAAVRDLFTDHADGYVYAIGANGGVLRTRDGITWSKHPSPGAIYQTNGLVCPSIAVAGETIFVGDEGGAIRAVASTKVRWQPASTSW